MVFADSNNFSSHFSSTKRRRKVQQQHRTHISLQTQIQVWKVKNINIKIVIKRILQPKHDFNMLIAKKKIKGFLSKITISTDFEIRK